MSGQVEVPFWFAIVIVVAGAVVSAALAYNDPAVVIAPIVKFALFLVNVALITLAAALNIKKTAA